MLRRARVRDAGVIQTLISECGPEIGMTTDFKGPDYLKVVKGWCRQGQVWVDELAGKVTGAMVMTGNEIFYLVVSAENRKGGVGRGLIKRAKLVCRRNGWSGLQAKVVPSNVPIVNLLKSEGFGFKEE
jgi:N-acetylglutamate synthase-like GNAT family acetyltransferase